MSMQPSNPTVPRLFRSPWVSILVLPVALGVVLASPSETRRFNSLLPVGTPAPEVDAANLEGGSVKLSSLKGQVVLLLFGELYNKNSVAAADDISELLERPAYADFGATGYLLVTQKAPPTELLRDARRLGVRLPILHDQKRKAFASYRVQVLPSLVMIDGDGTVVLSLAGHPLDFQDTVDDTLLYATGHLSEKEYQKRRDLETHSSVPEEQVKAVRLAALGEQLQRRGYVDLAMSTFREALALYPDCAAAHLGLGNCLLGRRELVEAEEHFLEVAESAPESLGASLGLIQIQVLRGGEELQKASSRVRTLLGNRPRNPQVAYVAGVVAEKSGDLEGALGHYKLAAELALYGQRRNW